MRSIFKYARSTPRYIASSSVPVPLDTTRVCTHLVTILAGKNACTTESTSEELEHSTDYCRRSANSNSFASSEKPYSKESSRHARFRLQSLPTRNKSHYSFLVQQDRPLSSCYAADTTPLKPTVSAQPGSVTPYSHHVLVRLPPAADQPLRQTEIWWPPVIENKIREGAINEWYRHPAIVQVFAAVAEARTGIEGIVKVTAYEDMEAAFRPDRERRADVMVFPAGVRYGGLPFENIKAAVRHHVAEKAAGPQQLNFPQAKQQEVEGLLLFVCTHASRDARCGVIGRAAARKLQSLVEARRLDQVKVYQTSHVGGHKFAGNVLVYGSISPCDGDWFGGITPDNAEAFLDALVNVEVGLDGGLESPQLRGWWRGRLGLSKQEQVEEFHSTSHIPVAGEDSWSSSEDDSSSSSDESSSSSCPSTSRLD